jgi:ribosome-binding factor A
LKKKSYRNIQVAEEIRKEISKILNFYCSDPRIKSKITIIEVYISNDFSYSKVFFTLLDEKISREIKEVLQNSSGYFRKLLSKNLFLRIVPKLKFIYDDSFIKGNRISKIIDNTIKIDKKNQK